MLPLAPAVGDAARAARKAGATVVIAVVHAGGNCPRSGVLTDQSPPDVAGCEGDAESFRLARALAARTDGGRVDAIFGGHTHQGVTAIVDGIPVLQAYDNGRAFSKLELEVDEQGQADGTLRRARARARDAPTCRPIRAVAAAVAHDLAEVDAAEVAQDRRHAAVGVSPRVSRRVAARQPRRRRDPRAPRTPTSG